MSRDPNDERVAREVEELLNPYGERAFVVEDQGALVDPGRILENVHQRMERVDLDPSTPWGPDSLISMDELTVMFVQLEMGHLVISQTAWFARQILARWPAELVERPLPSEARIEMFLDGPKVDPTDGDTARRVLNRALASPDEVTTHPELDGMSNKELVVVWMALVFWFGIKSGALHQREQ